MNPALKKRIVLTAEQIRCLASPARYGVYNALRLLRAASVSELANLMGRSSKGLYYHLGALQKVGLVEVASRRKLAKTEEAVFRATAERVSIGHYGPNRDWAALASSALRLAEQEVALASAHVTDPERLRRGVNLIRANVRLRPEDARRFEEMLLRAVDFAEGASLPDQGERLAVTLLTVPVAGGEKF